MSHDFLVEIGTEELPPTSLKALAVAFYTGIKCALDEQKLGFESITYFATPRRLAVLVKGLHESTPIEDVIVWGPPAKIAFDSAGEPSKAVLAFASKNALSVSELSTMNDGKQDKVVAHLKSGGALAKDLLGDIVRLSLAKLPIKKRMRWGSSRTEFVRPIRWLVMVLDEQVLDEKVLDMQATNLSRGHRVHFNHEINITKPVDYVEILRSVGHVIVDYNERKNLIREQVNTQADNVGGIAVIDEDLLDEVTGIVEWPVALSGQFDAEFLQVPAEALVSSMKEHQKYFHLVDSNNILLPYFITIANLVSKDPGQVISGNERVIRPRLADAAFFFETDKKTSLTSQREKLKQVVFQDKLGSVYQKTQRIEHLANFICKKLGVAPTDVRRTAQLCKSDLVSSMVYEFADMQGIAGYHYALNDGESKEVATAITEHYMPRFSGDALASSDAGAIVALADRIDTITGIFGLGQKPSGSKDPFALRRLSIGALRILVGKSYALDLRELIEASAAEFSDLPCADTVVDDVLSYMLDRFKSWYDEENIATEIFQAVQAKNLSCPLDIDKRVQAVAEFCRMAEAPALASANKRVSNILAKTALPQGLSVNEALLQADAEKDLAQTLTNLVASVTPLLNSGNYTEALKTLAQLRQPVDTFFDDVMVMVDDSEIKNNRLALLQQLRSIFLEVADISYLVAKV